MSAFDSDLEIDESANSDLDEEGDEFFLPTFAFGAGTRSFNDDVDSSDADSTDETNQESEQEEDILRKKQTKRSTILPLFYSSEDDASEAQTETRRGTPTPMGSSLKNGRKRKSTSGTLSQTTRGKRAKKSASRVRRAAEDQEEEEEKEEDEYNIVNIVEDALAVFGLTINSVSASACEEDFLSTAKQIQTAIASLSSDQKRDFARALPKTSPTTFVGARFAKRKSKMGPKDPDSVLNREEERKDGTYVRLSKIKHMRAQHVHYIHNLCNQYMSMLQTMIEFSLSSSDSAHSVGGDNDEPGKFERLVSLCNLSTDVGVVTELWPDASLTILSDADALEAHVNAATSRLSTVAAKPATLSSRKHLHTLITVVSALSRVTSVAHEHHKHSSTSSINTSSVLSSGSLCDLSLTDASVAIRVEIAFLMHDMACTGVWDRFRTMYGGPKARFKDEYMMMMRHGMDARVQYALDRIFTSAKGGKVQFAQQLRDFANVEHVQSFSRYVENNFKQKVSFHVCDQIEDVRHLRNKREMATMMWDTVMSGELQSSEAHRQSPERQRSSSTGDVTRAEITRDDDNDVPNDTSIVPPPSPERRRRRGARKTLDKKHIEQAKYEQSIYNEFFAPFDMDQWCTVQLVTSASTASSAEPSAVVPIASSDVPRVSLNEIVVLVEQRSQQKDCSGSAASNAMVCAGQKKARKKRWQQLLCADAIDLPPIVI